MMSYTPSQQVDNTQSNGSTKSTVPVQLPTGGFTIVPASKYVFIVGQHIRFMGHQNGCS